MNEDRSKVPGLRVDVGDTDPATRREDEGAASARPDEATERVEVRRLFDLLLARTLTFEAATAIENGRLYQGMQAAASSLVRPVPHCSELGVGRVPPRARFGSRTGFLSPSTRPTSTRPAMVGGARRVTL